MSSYLKPGIYNQKSLQRQWLNNACSFHDSFCGCEKPLDHLKAYIEEQQCPPTIAGTSTDTTGGIPGTEEDAFDDGDLEKLFAIEEEDNER